MAVSTSCGPARPRVEPHSSKTEYRWLDELTESFEDQQHGLVSNALAHQAIAALLLPGKLFRFMESGVGFSYARG
jgi:hypothetical protein